MTALLAPPMETDAFTRAMSSGPITAPLSPSVLIADDDDDVRDVIEYRLQVAGYRTMTADNGRSALSMAIERRPRVIILDVTMPQIDGLTVCNRLHASPATAEIPVLMISGNGRPADLDLGFEAGADDYLPKPFSTREMMRRVSWLLLSAGR
ncbi:response regulator [Paractinoplanes lichenicola]|uniref:Response regulator n=1 Tax=Paractinoplanes lichenicola TaxID=2802976 RepID=A0ABS1W1N1_9ACTN|nr:response regulator [Actinoplanes lichenicola]MBL7260620.1 response regulator [Actinoplanes lichenicola]